MATKQEIDLNIYAPDSVLQKITINSPFWLTAMSYERINACSKVFVDYLIDNNLNRDRDIVTSFREGSLRKKYYLKLALEIEKNSEIIKNFIQNYRHKPNWRQKVFAFLTFHSLTQSPLFFQGVNVMAVACFFNLADYRVFYNRTIDSHPMYSPYLDLKSNLSKREYAAVVKILENEQKGLDVADDLVIDGVSSTILKLEKLGEDALDWFIHYHAA